MAAGANDDLGVPDPLFPDTGERVVPMRLQKFLARAGVASRRGSEDLMTAGRVCVNGVVMTELGTKVDPNTDAVTVLSARMYPFATHASRPSSERTN